MNALDLGFWLLASLGIGAALAVVMVRDVFRAALALVLCLLTVAGLYITLSADFLAAAQVLIYVGGISVLIILAIMLTRDSQHGSQSNRLKLPAALVALLFVGVLGFSVLNTDWRTSAAAPVAPTTGPLAERLLGANGFVLPVEIAAALILAAVLGAIVIARDK